MRYLLVLVFVSLWSFGEAKEGPAKSKSSANSNSVVKAKMMDCNPPIAYTEFSLNNIRFGLESGGQLWENNGDASYEVPKVDEESGEVGIHSLYAGGLWLGGRSPDGQLRLAAVTFRSGGTTDYYNGPLTTDNNASALLCDDYDIHFPEQYQIPLETDADGNAISFRRAGARRLDASRHLAYHTALRDGGQAAADSLFPEGYDMPSYFGEWPGNNPEANHSFFLAPYVDFNENGEYDPMEGDYPGFDLNNEVDCRTRGREDPIPLFGDESMWWVFNDRGGVHTETGGEQIGMEIQAQAFAFTTTDDINNMTFYNYVLINRGTQTLLETYFGQWVDPDVGCSQDDFVGCDVSRGLGYAYNGTNNDETCASTIGYGANPPAIGIDFFEGPYQDTDSINNPLTSDLGEVSEFDGIPYQGIGLGYLDLELFESLYPGVDPLIYETKEELLEVMSAAGYDILNLDPRLDLEVDNERFGMRRFVYYTLGGDASVNGEPNTASDYYNYLRGIWRDGRPMTYGGLGVQPEDEGSPALYMFPGTSDPLGFGSEAAGEGELWSEISEGLDPEDRRFIQSAGEFVLDPGEFNNVTVGVVWVRPFADQATTLDFLRIADDKAQSLFDNCFRLLSGPDAPDVQAVELDQEIILYITNSNPTSNNFNESYGFGQPGQFAFDPLIPTIACNGDTLEEEDKYYEFQGYKVYQLKNSQVSSSELNNPDLARLQFQTDIADGIGQIINYVDDPSIGLKVPVEAVNGADQGLTHAFQITEDLFSGSALVNQKRYYFMVIAYAYNEWSPYNASTLCGQASPYLESRKSATGGIEPILAMPQKEQFSEGGTVTNSEFGDGLEVTRYEGLGNNATFLELTDESIDNILQSPTNSAGQVTYEAGNTPISVSVFNPLMVFDADFELLFDYDIVSPRQTEFRDSDESLLERGERFDDQVTWSLVIKQTNGEIDTIRSTSAIDVGSELLLVDYGISVNLRQRNYTPGLRGSNNDAFHPLDRPNVVGAEIEYENEELSGWLLGVRDVDGPLEQNWIRSGSFVAAGGQGYCQGGDPASDCYYYDWTLTASGDEELVDPTEQYESLLNGTIAPWRLVSASWAGPSTEGLQRLNDNAQTEGLHRMNDVDMVFTPDKSLWSRVPVLEINNDPGQARGRAEKLFTRRALSVDKNGLNQLNGGDYDECTMNGTQILTQEDVDDMDSDVVDELLLVAYPLGNADGPSDLVGLSFGMSWFPGYSIDVGTGERLNMAFGENSFLALENGIDMIWNPTSNLYSTNNVSSVLRNPETARFGGMHYTYVFRNRARELSEYDRMVPQYDNGEFLYNNLNGNDNTRNRIFLAATWVYAPLVRDEDALLSIEDGLIPTKTTIKVRVAKPYERYAPVTSFTDVFPGEHRSDYEDTGEPDFPYFDYRHNTGLYDASAFQPAAYPNADGPAIDQSINQWLPVYGFTTRGFEVTTGVTSVLETALDVINVVPNPYYGFSEYENGRLDQEVRIINLPERCNIRIYNTGGTLVRTFIKDAPGPNVEWDLRNERNVPISGGTYIIHIEIPGVGETVVKWFGAMRPIDLNNF